MAHIISLFYGTATETADSITCVNINPNPHC